MTTGEGEVRPRAYLMTGPWELDPEGNAPGIYMDSPTGGDPVCLATLGRVYHPKALQQALSLPETGRGEM